MLSWQGVVPGGGASPPPDTAAAGTPPGVPPESRLYFADYRDVDGLKLPFRIRRAVGAHTVETTFDRFRINAKIDSMKFEVR